MLVKSVQIKNLYPLIFIRDCASLYVVSKFIFNKIFFLKETKFEVWKLKSQKYLLKITET